MVQDNLRLYHIVDRQTDIGINAVYAYHSQALEINRDRTKPVWYIPHVMKIITARVNRKYGNK